jgi:prepilin-type N-terminal cleavage/methylation domain-containing protein
MNLPRTRPSRLGFTLVEMLVAMVILAIIGIVISQMISSTSDVTTVEDKHADADDQSRAVFDRMENDFAQMVKSSGVDYIFWKANGNDTMFFYSEAASYFTSGIYQNEGATPYPFKSSVSLIGYRIDNDSATPSPTCYQFQRLGMPLTWDSGPTSSSGVPTPVVFLTYPLATTPNTPVYSTALFNSTLAGAYSNGGNQPSIVGTQAGDFNDCTVAAGDTYNAAFYHSIGTQVFRFEFAFQHKDGTSSGIPVMAQTKVNGLPFSTLTAGAPPTASDDSSGGYAVGSRWYDTTNQIGYTCLDATPSAAVWHEIGLQDISAIIVTIAVIDHQGLVLMKSQGTASTVMPKLQAQLIDGTDSSVAQSWATALAPVAGSQASPVSTAQRKVLDSAK